MAKKKGRIGDLEESSRPYRIALRDFSQCLGKIHCCTLACLGNLAKVVRAMGNYQEAVVLHQEELLGFLDTLGSQHSTTIGALIYLG